MNNLRKKLGKNWIVTIRGVGYKFSKKGDIAEDGSNDGTE
ncbi:MAG: helix-turn-helix domain-containing protein [Fervidobacterium sp.]